MLLVSGVATSKIIDIVCDCGASCGRPFGYAVKCPEYGQPYNCVGQALRRDWENDCDEDY